MQMELASQLGSMQVQHDSLLGKHAVASNRIQGLKSSSNNGMLKKFSMSFDDLQDVIENLKVQPGSGS